MTRNLLLFITLISSPFISMAQSGITWNTTIDVNTMSMYGNDHPRIVLDRSGDPMILWGNSGNNNAYFSKWNGSFFSTPTIVNTGVPVFASSWAGPDITSNGDTVYIVVKETPETTNPAFIYTSFNGGTSFSGPVQIDGFIADSISRFPTVTANNMGNPVVAFMKINPDFSNARWVVTKSNDYGSSFSADVLASNWSGGEVCDCCPASIINDGNNVAVLYRDNNSNIRDMWTGISTDGGSSFNNGYALDSPNWMLMACPSTGPDGIIIGDTMYSVLMSGFTGTNLIYISRSSISGLATASVNPATGMLAGLSLQNFPRIASDGSAVGIVWKQAVSGQTQLPLLFTNNINNGFPVQFDTVDIDDVTNADIAISNGIIHIVWEDPTSGTVKYRSGTFTPSLNVNTPNETQLIKLFPNPISSQLTLTLNDNISGSAEINIINMQGQMVLTQFIQIESGYLSMNLADLSNGSYTIEVITENQKFISRFIKK